MTHLVAREQRRIFGKKLLKNLLGLVRLLGHLDKLAIAGEQKDRPAPAHRSHAIEARRGCGPCFARYAGKSRTTPMILAFRRRARRRPGGVDSVVCPSSW